MLRDKALKNFRLALTSSTEGTEFDAMMQVIGHINNVRVKVLIIDARNFSFEPLDHTIPSIYSV